MGLLGKHDFIKLKPVLSSVNPENLSTFRKAYSYGLSMILDYNKILVEKKDIRIVP